MGYKTKFDIKIYFPDKDVVVLQQLAKDGVFLYPMLTSKDEDTISYAIGILEANKLVVGRICRKEFMNDSCQYEYLSIHLSGQSVPDFFAVNNIHLLTLEEREEDNINLDNYDYSLIPTFIPLYIRYIQQDGKL